MTGGRAVGEFSVPKLGLSFLAGGVVILVMWGMAFGLSLYVMVPSLFFIVLGTALIILGSFFQDRPNSTATENRELNRIRMDE